nr:hypothetical protein [Tanacetum cinerariifolium]
MAPLPFADTHNMVSYLSKSDASKGFDQIMDFLNDHTIQYALVVNPAIYVSCIKQFRATAKVKKELARMGYEKPPPKLTFYKAFFSAQWKFVIHTLVRCLSAKRTTWKEFSCSIASAVICLATAEEEGKEVRKEKEVKVFRVQKAEKGWGKIEAIDADKDITLVDVKKDEETLFKPYKDAEEPKKKRVADETLLQESFKKLRAAKVSEIIQVSKFKVEALQVKYPIIDWEIYIEGSRKYWKIISVGGITEAYQSFKDMLRGFYREDLVALWNLVKDKFSSAVPSEDKEKALWVELKRLFEPDVVEEDSEMAKDLVMKIFIELKIMLFKDLRKMDKGINVAGSSITLAGSTLMLLDKVDAAAEVLKNLL